jgi:tetratricopeptide (TPR) repeat protein
VQRYRLDKLDDAAARQLLASYIDGSRLDAEPDAIEALLRWFDGLPLGLELAARYLALDDWLSIADYLAELTLTHESLQANPEMRYPDGVEAAITVSWARLKPETEDGQAARRLAMRLGLFGAALIPLLPEWKREWRKGLQRLVNLNLLERDADSVALHPLVRQFVRGQLAEDELIDFQTAVLTYILGEAIDAYAVFTVEQALQYTPWIPHVEEIAMGLIPQAVNKDVVSTDQIVLLTWIGRVYEKQGLYELAEPLYREALAIKRENLPANHPSLAIGLNNLAALYYAQGKYEAAEPLYREALAIKRENLPANHPSLAIGLNNLAGLYESQGKYEAAEPLYQEALAIVRESLPANHPDLAINLNNLAKFLYTSQEKYEEAEPLFLDALEICINSLGDDHPLTQKIRGNVIDFYQTALAAGHPDTRLRNHPLGDLIRSRLQ